MYSLTIDEVLAFVRKSIDETIENGSSMLSTDIDAESLDEIVKDSIPEAIVLTHSAAPVSRLSGKVAEAESSLAVTSNGDGSVKLVMKVDTLRIVSVHMSDSPFTVTSIFEEDTPQGRMQKNPYTKGTWDNPTVILNKVSKSGARKPELTYYSLKDREEADVKPEVEYIPYPEDGSESYEVSDDLRFAVLNMAVSLVMTAFMETDVATVFSERAQQYMK